MRRTVLMIALVVLAAASPAVATDKNGLYIGGILGWANIDLK
jgi:hypothetical protein